MLLLRWLMAFVVAYLLGKILSKFRLPSLLGWLIAGMIMGPYALGIMNEDLINARWYELIQKFMECSVGFMIGTELLLKKLKKSGKALIGTTLFQSLGTFVFVSAVFSLVFSFLGVDIYLAVIFGGIALATAPAPALSIVQEFKTKGPVTDTLIPMAALDDVVAVVVFFTTISLIATHGSGGEASFFIVPVIIFMPIIIGIVTGFIASLLLRRVDKNVSIIAVLVVFVTITTFFGVKFNEEILSKPLLNFMLMGMAFSAMFTNMVDNEKLERVNKCFRPILFVSIMGAIINLGVPLNYNAIFGAGLFTVVYILSRAFGKYFGAKIGAKIFKMPDSVQKYLGLTLLPHSGVSLVFTGISAQAISKFAPDNAVIIQGTIAAAAIINEIIAVIMAKKGFEWAGEIGKETVNSK